MKLADLGEPDGVVEADGGGVIAVDVEADFVDAGGLEVFHAGQQDGAADALAAELGGDANHADDAAGLAAGGSDDGPAVAGQVTVVMEEEDALVGGVAEAGAVFNLLDGVGAEPPTSGEGVVLDLGQGRGVAGLEGTDG